ncbi:MAG: hypothetical protein IAE78_27395 [Myxococcus sp.]|nr:hypothetical protein [Myxococcus sp.]
MNRRWLILVLSVATSVSAECPAAGLEVSPLPGKVASRPWIVLGLQGQLANEVVIDQLVLRRGPTRIKLQLVSTAWGANWRQEVITPAEALAAGRWTLEALPDGPVARAVSDHLRLAEFEVTGADRVPVLVSARLLGARSNQAGCGSDARAEVLVETDEPSAMVEVTLTATAYTTTVVLPLESRPLAGPLQGHESVIGIGFELCGGPVSLPPDTTFTATLTPLSTAGRRGAPHVVIFSTPAGEPGPRSFVDTVRAFELLGPSTATLPSR